MNRTAKKITTDFFNFAIWHDCKLHNKQDWLRIVPRAVSSVLVCLFQWVFYTQYKVSSCWSQGSFTNKCVPVNWGIENVRKIGRELKSIELYNAAANHRQDKFRIKWNNHKSNVFLLVVSQQKMCTLGVWHSKNLCTSLCHSKQCQFFQS